MKYPSPDVEIANYIAALEEEVIRLQAQGSADPQLSSEDREQGTCNVQFRHSLDSLSDEDIYLECKRDPRVWRLTQIWKKKRSNGFIYSANFHLLEKDPEEHFRTHFSHFLQTWKPRAKPTKAPHPSHTRTHALLILDKQDFHFNKHDRYGRNSVAGRFEQFESKTSKIARKAARNYNLDLIHYIVGSDAFNSEWTGMTVNGTPQQNLLPYDEGFEAILDHEIRVIQSLLKSAQAVEIIYIPGNHDEHVGWHLIKTLQVYFRGEPRLTFDTKLEFTKYKRYNNTALCYNHGAEVKPQKLANAFPVEFKEEWSFTEFWYIFTGDKHRRIEQDFSGIEFYGIPALSTAKSRWEALNAHTGTKAKYTAFLIEEGEGMTDIYKEPML
jgi:hypothetical protein